ncbi:MAG: twin-arginine translocation pathway signal [Rhodobacteraceae bacterium]|nr:twin-arginine translocation pathway signal [Paracoccaceae bacterium]
MPDRRSFLGGLLAATSLATTSWAAAGGPAYLAAARGSDGSHALIGLDGAGEIAFDIPLPARGHAAAAHPSVAEAVAIARRPGTYGIVLDCRTGAVKTRIEAPRGRHFYGHGAFSQDGTRLYTPENVIDTGEGRIGIWSREAGYARLGDVASGGIGPHEILRIPGSTRLVIANGGIRTHPDSGREKLNLDTMAPNLTVMSEAGEILDQAALEEDWHQNSLRHISAAPDGRVACAFQWQGDLYDPAPLVAVYHPGRGLDVLDVPEGRLMAMNGYAGSVAFFDGDRRIAVTSPRGSVLQVYDAVTGFVSQMPQEDVCGVAPGAAGAMCTDGLGRVGRIGVTGVEPLARHPLAFDNHLVALPV